MATGSNSSSPEVSPPYVFAGHLRYDGVQMIRADLAGKKLEACWQKDWLATQDPGQLIGHLKDFLEELSPAFSQAERVHWSLSTAGFCLIPDIFYEQNKGRDYLAHTTRLEEDDNVLSDFWRPHDIVSIYTLPEVLLRFLQEQHAQTHIAHNGFAIQALNQKEDEDFCLLQISPYFAELFIAQKGKVLFYNQFQHQVPEDLVYYTLFALEQYRLPAPEIEMYLVECDDPNLNRHKLLERYIGKVQNLPPSSLTANADISTRQKRQVAHLTALLQ